MPLFLIREPEEGRTFTMVGEDADAVATEFVNLFYDPEFVAEEGEELEVTIIELKTPKPDEYIELHLER